MTKATNYKTFRSYKAICMHAPPDDRTEYRMSAKIMPELEADPTPPQPGSVSFGDLHRLQPLSQVFGFDRGTPVDRYYVERFLSSHSESIAGRVLEVGNDQYTRRFGGGRVQVSDVLNVNEGVAGTTIVADLAVGTQIPSEAFDCVIVTQTLHLVYDVAAALRTLHRVLRPGGVLLLTSPGTISQLGPGEWGGHWFWGFSPLAMRRLFGEVFAAEHYTVTSYGNVLASVGFLQGMASEEFPKECLEHNDTRYPLLLSVHARKEVRRALSAAHV